MNRRSASLNKKSKPRFRYLKMERLRHGKTPWFNFDYNLKIPFSKSSHKDDVWINPFIRPPICSIIIAVSISFVGACLLYLDRDESIILSKQVSLQRKIKFQKWPFQTQLWSLIITGGGSLLLLISLGMMTNILIHIVNFITVEPSSYFEIGVRGPKCRLETALVPIRSGNRTRTGKNERLS